MEKSHHLNVAKERCLDLGFNTSPMIRGISSSTPITSHLITPNKLTNQLAEFSINDTCSELCPRPIIFGEYINKYNYR